MRFVAKIVLFALPCLSGCSMLSQVPNQGAAANAEGKGTTFPSYVRPISQFETTYAGTFGVQDKENKSPYSGAPVVMMQPTPPGYVGAHHPTIKNYDMQRITEQRFIIDGKELAFIANPTKSDMNYWTIGKEASAGWDTNVLVFKPKPGATSIALSATYVGVNGVTVYDPNTRTGKSLSPQEMKEFLRLEDEGYTGTSKATMDKVLSRQGLVRGKSESEVDYALRLAHWMNNIPPVRNGGGQDDIAQSIERKIGGNCNQYAGIETFVLRSQGIPARMLSGYEAYFDGRKDEQHVLAEFFCSNTGCWYRMPQATTDTDPRKVFGFHAENEKIFQIDTTYWPEFSFPQKVEGTGSSNGCGEWIIYEGGENQGSMSPNPDKSRSWSKPLSK